MFISSVISVRAMVSKCNIDHSCSFEVSFASLIDGIIKQHISIKIKLAKAKYLKRFWNWLLGKTTIDEEIKERVNRVKEEVADVKTATKEVVSQVKDVVDAAKGKKRRGRPKKK